MTKFVRGDVVQTPFPGDASADEKQTALVISPSDLEHARGLLWVALVTKQEDPAWRGDVPILDSAVAGTPAHAVIRTARLATVPAESAKRIGRISGVLLGRVLGEINGALGRL
ncbi:MAG: type II toxin-antitoxin system PemK/MazF family toxin [Burkholderiaceae bacterium]|jgi:hypothetical protein|nr:type II toxin-antitoxin system PemK/MazF family toxin [Burkholderiaceae bacterium]